jgi:hypothetical protein
MREILMFKTEKEDYRKFIVSLGIVPALILLEKFEKLELYEECSKIIGAIDLINKKAVVYKETKLTDDIINNVIDDYIKMGMTDMNREKLLKRSEKHADSFISSNSFVIYKDKGK